MKQANPRRDAADPPREGARGKPAGETGGNKELVGAARFELTTSWTQTRRACRAAPRPDGDVPLRAAPSAAEFEGGGWVRDGKHWRYFTASALRESS